MKRKSLFTTFIILSAVLTLTSCENASWDFPDYEYQSVYFAYQYPVRTIILGEHRFDNELDNNHQFKIMATTGGIYNNNNDVVVDYEIDESMVDGFQFESGDPIQVLPGNYYNIISDSDQLTIPEGELVGGATIELTDAYFQDPASFNITYVLPVRMTSVANADTILQGQPKEIIDNPRRGVAGDWEIQPKDFTFYAVKYINRLDGFYLRRGEDQFTDVNGSSNTRVRRTDYVVKDEVVELHTQGYTQAEFPFTLVDGQGNDISVSILLDFNEQGEITVSDNAADYTATGSGTLVNKSESQETWGDKSRNAIYLDYEISWDNSQRHVATADTLVLRDRGIAVETFVPELQ